MDTTTAIVPVDNEQNRYIELAQARAGENMFSIQDFVRVINYNIDPLFVDEQWNMLNAQRPEELILLTAPMLERLHFSRIANLIKKLQQLFPASRGNNNEYWGDDVNVSISLSVPFGTDKQGRGGARSFKQIKMTKGAYKELLMETQTDAARQVRKYYICLEELFVQYLLYQRAYEFVQAQVEKTQLSQQLGFVIQQNSEIIEQNKELKVLSETQTQQLKVQSQQLGVQSQKLDTLARILYNESDNKVLDVKRTQKKQELVVLQDRTDATRCEIIRGQRNHIVTQLKRKHETMEIVGKIDTYKNPINLYNRFNEHKDSTKFEIRNNQVTLKNGTVASDLLNVLQDLDNNKHDVAETVRTTI